MEDKRKWCVAFEEAAKRTLKYLEDGEDLKVGLSELKEQLERRKKQAFPSCRVPNSQGMREAKSSSRFSDKERLRRTSPAWRGGVHNSMDWWSWKGAVRT